MTAKKFDLGIDNAAVNKLIQDAAVKETRRVKVVSEYVMDKLRRQATEKWSKKYGMNPDSTLKAIDTDSHSKSNRLTGVEITTSSFVDADKYPIEHTSLYKRTHKDTEESRNRYGGKFSSRRRTVFYIAEHLQYGLGVIGLPKKSKYNLNWNNPNYNKASESLEDFTQNYITRNFSKTFKTEYKKRYGGNN